MRIEVIPFDTDDIFSVYNASQSQTQTQNVTYTKIHRKIRIKFDLSENTSTEQAEQSVSSGKNLEPQSTAGIFQKCPRFRILVVMTGVGKSSLINHVFGVRRTIVAHDRPGQASIDDESFSPQNTRFVLHHSEGFKPGREDNLDLVQDFIRRRSAMPDLKDKLHAVWLCLQTPPAGECLLDTGTKNFLTWTTLENIPVILVLTKYDMLIKRTPGGSSLSYDDHKELAKKNAEDELQNTWIGPLRQFPGLDIPRATISTEDDYEETLTHLIQITENCVGRHFMPEAATILFIAQRVDPELKIKASIEVGKQKYWKALASCPTFENRTMWDCLYVLHTDIANVWNFCDPHHYLYSQEFRRLMVNMVDMLEVGPTADSTKTRAFGLSMLGTITSIVAGPAVPIAVPIPTGTTLAVWTYDIYQISYATLQRFMAYIIHLTLVLQTLYLVSESQEVTRRSIKLAVASYLASPMSEDVLTSIQDYGRLATTLEHANDDTFNIIFDVYTIKAAEMSKLRAKMLPVDLLSDKPW
ncbi:uncharacterized protein F5147DRAFT_763257 [Suillus discolor]|uniref:G domain-containing protein n=1 Tax=Suillus discolor TaxID=1912936 RepID=A0A9P7JQF0_9AGAM|nr:uncharacterized protein F5147DRAFT_763257 [Suillus discolor]KAG2098458.1 hypothetical protein F5147DRAFT_763257 [Suillus discolor]